MPWPMLPSTVNSGSNSPATIPGCSTLQVGAGGREGEVESWSGGPLGSWEKETRWLSWSPGLEDSRAWLVRRVRGEPRGWWRDRAWKLPAPLPQGATRTASGSAETKSSTSTGEAPSLGSSAVPVAWTGAAWTLLCTVTVTLTSPSGEGGKGTGLSGSWDT